MKKESIVALAVGISLLIIIVYGIGSLYSIESPSAVETTSKQGTAIKPENKIAIAHTEIFGVLQRPQVIFDHNKHTEAFKKEGKKEGEGCDTCHPLNKEKDLILFDFPKKLEGKDKDSVMNSYHDACINCHKERLIAKKKAGPVICADCHAEKLQSVEIKYPVFEFDFQVHNTHVKKLKEKIGKDDCSLCHHSYDIHEEDESLRLVYEEGTEESCYYCHEFGKKKGPELTAITSAASKKGLSIREASHIRCLNCHLYYTLKQEKASPTGEKKVGPIVCTKCHTGKYKTIAELAKVPRPDRDQPEKPLIEIENAKMKGVSFDHKLHENNSKTCRDCHHETLNACKKCHNIMGSPDGKWVSTANAYHDISSGKSCAGCHRVKKSDKNCAGCHYHLLPVDLHTMDPKKELCSVCHTGKKERLSTPRLTVSGLDTKTVKKEVEIKTLEKEFDPAKFPHLKIIEKFVKISNDSKMASYFHRKLQTICDGCHHQSRAEAELKKDTPPNCRNCHTIAFDPVHLNRPRLLAVYHRQCISCHNQMNLEKPRECKECHKEKAVRPVDIVSKPPDYETR
jgi:hypothetical protein